MKILVQDKVSDRRCGARAAATGSPAIRSMYTVGSILRLTEGTLAPVACLENDAAPCERVGECRTLPLWQGLFKLINDYFDGTTIADLMASSQDGDNYII